MNFNKSKITGRGIKFLLSAILYFHLLVSISFSQGQKPYGEFSKKAISKTEKKLLKSARKEFETGDYSTAVEKYEELLKIDSTNPVYNFEQAQTFFNNFHQIQSIPYFERALRYSKDTLAEIYYFIANAYHLAGKFGLAKKNYTDYLSMLNIYGTDLPEDEENQLKGNLKRKIEMCGNGEKLSQTLQDKFTLNGKTRSFRIVSVGKNVNTDYDDYGVVLSSNDSMMYFTSRRDGTGGKVDWDDKYFEDIYVSVLGNKGWGESFGIGPPINTKKHEGVIGISADGKTLYFYKGVKQGTFYYSNLFGNAWTKPKVLFEKSNVNTKAWETSFFGFVMAGEELYVVSDREGGTGGRDIYVTKKQPDGLWGPLVNLGEPINTKYDEDAPFITSDGKTMYFSSQGHNSIGGFDIFKSERLPDGKWAEPVNLGIPFNTTGDDIYFVAANKTDRAYFSSSLHNPDGSTDMDIYMIDLCDDIQEIILAGKTFGIIQGTIAVSEKESGNKIGDFKIENGKYSIRLAHGREYLFTLDVPDIKPATIDVAIPPMCKVYDLYQELDFSLPGQPLVVRNAFFDIKKESAITGVNDYSELLRKLDKSLFPSFTEQTISTISAVVLAKADTTKPIITAATATTSAAAGTTTVTAGGTTTAAAGTTTTTTSTQGEGATAESAVTTISINNILFDFDKSDIKKEFYPELDKVVGFLKNINKKAKIEVAGHTDSKGSDAYNLALSKRRANAVANYFATKGIGKSRMKIVGYGKYRPIAPNENPDGSDNADGRAKNRRTEIIVIQ